MCTDSVSIPVITGTLEWSPDDEVTLPLVLLDSSAWLKGGCSFVQHASTAKKEQPSWRITDWKERHGS